MYGNIAMSVLKKDYTLRCLRVHLFSVFTIKMPRSLVALAPFRPLNREDTDKSTLFHVQCLLDQLSIVPVMAYGLLSFTWRVSNS